MENSLIYKNILDNVHAGVISIDPDSKIVTFNPAAERILGMPQTAALGKSYAEVFLEREDLDAFNQAILDAIYNDKLLQRVTRIRVAGKERSISLTTSHLQGVGEDAAQTMGVIAIFSDITEISELRESELRMAESLKEQHGKLQTAYQDIEERNQQLGVVLKRNRLLTTMGVGILLAGVIVVWALLPDGDDSEFVYDDTGPAPRQSQQSLEPVAADLDDLNTIVVGKRRVTQSISLTGQLAPNRQMNISAPFDGKIVATYFRFGERASRGQRLLELDTTAIRKTYRQAEIKHIQALKKFNELKDWENSPDVLKSRRSLSKNKLALETQKLKLEQSEILFNEGVVAASEYEANKQQYYNQQVDFEGLKQDHQAILDRGNEDALRIARLELDNAVIELQEQQALLDSSVITAPVDGIVLEPSQDSGKESGKGGAKAIAPGTTVSKNQMLLSVSDLSALSVDSKADEIDIGNIKTGSSVIITGVTFPDMELTGEITHVSAQAQQGGGGGQGGRQAPKYTVTASVTEITEAQREQLRLGMSVNLRVTIYDKPEALVLPIDAVQRRVGKAWLRVYDPANGSVKQVEVETGATDLDTVEIIDGVEAGARVVIDVAAG